MADTSLSGKSGVVNGVDGIELWSLDVTAELHKHFLSNTQGGPLTVKGNTNWRGRWEAPGHTPAVLPAAGFTFLGSFDGSVGAEGPALADSARISWDLEGGRLIRNVVEFGANGVLSRGAAVASDVSTPGRFTSKGMQLKIDSSAEDNVRTMELMLSADNKPYNDSGTLGDTKRRAGNFDCTASYSRYCSAYSQLPTEGTIIEVQMYVTDTLYWHIKWLMVEGITDVQVNRQTGDLIAATVGLSFTGFDAAGATGFVKTPAAATVWPA